MTGTRATHLGREKEPETRYASRLSLVGRVVSLDRRLHRPVKREGAFVGEPPLRGAVL